MRVLLATMSLLFAVGCAAAAITPTTEPNMNGEYLLAPTPKAPNPKWSTNFKDYPGGVESFTVYAGPITSTYAEVFWTSLPEVNLPDDIVKRFKGKGMAVVGFEADQVRKGAGPNGEDVSVRKCAHQLPRAYDTAYMASCPSPYCMHGHLMQHPNGCRGQLSTWRTTTTTQPRCWAKARTWSVFRMIQKTHAPRFFPLSQAGARSLWSTARHPTASLRVSGVAIATAESSERRTKDWLRRTRRSSSRPTGSRSSPCR